MKTRVVQLIAVCVFLSIALSLLLPQPHTFAAPIALVAPTPTATSTPSPLEQATSTISHVKDTFLNFLFALANIVAAVVTLILGILLLQRIIQFLRSSTLVVDVFSNATGNDDLTKGVVGLSQLAREELAQELEKVRLKIMEYKHLAPMGYKVPDKRTVPAGASDAKLSDLLKSLQDVTSGETKVAVQLLNLVFPPRGTKVAMTLQSTGNTPAKLGISLEVTDLRGNQDPTLQTFWEETPVTPLSQQLEGTHEPQASMSSPVEQRNPLEEDKDAQASYELGKFYEEQRVLDSAMSHYEDALKKQPSFAKAREAIKHLLVERKTLEQRYMVLLRPVMHWLAIELARLSMAQHYIYSEEKRNIYQAELYNFIGDLHLSGAQTYTDFSFFYQLAIGDFKKAIRFNPSWHSPYENIADTYSIRGASLKAATNTKDLRQALSFYDKALCHPLQQVHSTSSVWIQIERRIQISKALTQLLLQEQELTLKAIDTMERLTKGWDVTQEKDGRALYNLACCYALASRLNIDIQDAMHVGRKYLAYSLILSRNLWEVATRDSELKGVNEDVAKLTEILLQNSQELPKIRTLSMQDFEKKVQELMHLAQWS